MSARAFHLIVFDLDGTLVDSRRDIAAAANALLESYGSTALPEARIGRMVGDGASVLVARAFAAVEQPMPTDALPRFLRIYGERLLEHTRPYPGMTEVLTALQARARLAVLTNKPIGATRELLAGLSLDRYFDQQLVIGGDGPLPRKPDPSGLQALLTACGAAPSSTLFVGDSIIDWQTAHAAGVRICLARYGFGFEGFPVDRLEPTDLTIDAPADLLSL